ncbi:hypothetical protein ACH5RR_001512 [Cinchona calisaya]|uniref:Uncharacterized protein n=1 Tax=Cinchona calisaya TaxID=153742 RepID=A0ABD3B486_9GENT
MTKRDTIWNACGKRGGSKCRRKRIYSKRNWEVLANYARVSPVLRKFRCAMQCKQLKFCRNKRYVDRTLDEDFRDKIMKLCKIVRRPIALSVWTRHVNHLLRFYQKGYCPQRLDKGKSIALGDWVN